MKKSTLIAGGLAALAAAVLFKKKGAISGTNTERQLELDFGDDFYDSRADLFGDRVRKQEPYSELVMRSRNRYGLRGGVVDAETGDEYDPLDVYEVWGQSKDSLWRKSPNDYIQLAQFDGKQLRNLAYNLRKVREKARRNHFSADLYQNGKFVTKLVR